MIDGIVVVGLLVLLATKYLSDGSTSEFANRLSRFMTLGIIPLSIIFFFILIREIINAALA